MPKPSVAQPPAQNCLYLAYERLLRGSIAVVGFRDGVVGHLAVQLRSGASWSDGTLAAVQRVARAKVKRASTLRLRGEVHALEEGLEAGVGAEGVR